MRQGGNVNVHLMIKNQDISKDIIGQTLQEIGIVIPLQCQTILRV